MGKLFTKANGKRFGIIAVVAVAGVAIVTGLGFMQPLVTFVAKTKARIATIAAPADEDA